MLELFLIVVLVILEYIMLKNFLSVNLKEYQGFSTRFFFLLVEIKLVRIA